MSTSEWPVVVAILISIASLTLALFARRDTKASADAAKLSAEAAKASAEAAKASAEAEQAMARLELEREHDRLAPPKPLAIEGEFAPTPQLGEGQGSLMGTIVVPRAYRVRAEVVSGNNSRSELGLLVLPANEQVHFEIEHWSPGRVAPQAKAVQFRFWPPNASDPGGDWTCRCGRPTEDGDGTGPCHWEWDVVVTYSSPDVRTFE